MMRGPDLVIRRLAVLAVPGLAVALAVPAAAQTEPARVAVTATSDHCAGGLPVVDYTLTNRQATRRVGPDLVAGGRLGVRPRRHPPAGPNP